MGKTAGEREWYSAVLRMLRHAADAPLGLLVVPRGLHPLGMVLQCLSFRMQRAAFILFPLNSRSEDVSGGGGRGKAQFAVLVSEDGLGGKVGVLKVLVLPDPP